MKQKASVSPEPQTNDPQRTAWSAVVINYNGEEQILGTIASLLATVNPPVEIIVVDDGSTDSSLDLVAQSHPQVQILKLGKNTGCTSMVRNMGLFAAKQRYVLVSDNDIEFLPDSVQNMLAVMQNREDAALCTPVVCYADNPNEVCVVAHPLHYCAWSALRDEHNLSELIATGPFQSIGCGIQLIDRERIAGLGGFDEKLKIAWCDDGEFHHRIHMAGLACYSVPDAKILHKRIRVKHRRMGQIHNRLILMFKCYELRTLVVLSPALVLFEAMLAAYMLVSGIMGEYFRAVGEVFSKRGAIMQDRRKLQANRKRTDRQLLSAGILSLPKGGRGKVSRTQALASSLFRVYWRLASPLLRREVAK